MAAWGGQGTGHGTAAEEGQGTGHGTAAEEGQGTGRGSSLTRGEERNTGLRDYVDVLKNIPSGGIDVEKVKITRLVISVKLYRLSCGL